MKYRQLTLLLIMAVTCAWSMSSFALLSGSAASLVQVTITADFVELHGGPGRGFPVFHVAEKNAELAILAEKLDWVKVRTSKGTEGWVATSELASARLSGSERRYSFGQLEAADDVQRRIEVGVFTGKFAGDSMFGVLGAYRFTRYVAVELAWESAVGVYSTSTYSRVGLRANLRPNAAWSPYVLGGGGMFGNTPRSTLVANDPLTGTTLQAGAGLSYAAAKGLDVRAAVLSHWLSGKEARQFTEWQLGLTTRF